MNRHVAALVACATLLSATACSSDSAEEDPTPTASPDPIATPEPTLEPTPESLETPTPTPFPYDPVPYDDRSIITTMAGSGEPGTAPADTTFFYGDEHVDIYLGSNTGDYAGDGGQATAARLDWPTGVAIDPSGNVFIADQDNAAIRRVSPEGVITTFVSAMPGQDPDEAANWLYGPGGVAADALGNVYVADTWGQVIWKVDTKGRSSIVAGGTDDCYYAGDGGPATEATLCFPTGVAVNSRGELFIADYLNNVVRKVDADGVISTVAGTGSAGFSGDGGPATQAMLDLPGGIAFDGQDNLYLTDNLNHRIRKVDTAGIITTLAGSGRRGYYGDGGPALQASLEFPTGVVADGQGRVFFTDTLNNVVRMVTPEGLIFTVAGNGVTGDYGMGGFSGDGGPATTAMLNEPYAIRIDASGALIIADAGNNRIRRVVLDAVE